MTKNKASSFRSSEKRERPGRFKFQVLAEEIERDLRTFYEPGQRFESEPSLCKRFGLNRETVRRAILQLEQQGLLQRKGRAGAFVADFRKVGYDDRLIGVAMAIRNHMWDSFFHSLSAQSIAHSRYPLICDFSDADISHPFGSRLPATRMAERLSAVLRLRPRTLVTDLANHEDEAMASLGEMRSFFNNLILINQPKLHGFARCASVRVDIMAGHMLQGRSARAAGYERLIFLLPHGSAPVPEMQSQLATPEGGSFPFAKQAIVYEHDPDRDAHLVESIRRTNAPVALIANYDYGAHLAKGALQTAGLWDPSRIGLYGMNNTPWAVQDDLTSVGFDPDVWARMVFEAEAELEAKGTAADRLVPPTLIERGSTMKLPG